MVGQKVHPKNCKPKNCKRTEPWFQLIRIENTCFLSHQRQSLTSGGIVVLCTVSSSFPSHTSYPLTLFFFIEHLNAHIYLYFYWLLPRYTKFYFHQTPLDSFSSVPQINLPLHASLACVCSAWTLPPVLNAAFICKCSRIVVALGSTPFLTFDQYICCTSLLYKCPCSYTSCWWSGPVQRLYSSQSAPPSWTNGCRKIKSGSMFRDNSK